jgi:protein-tyrosine-phosphatase
MGEAVLVDIAKKRGLDIQVDSAGTAAYHVGETPDDRYAHTPPSFRTLTLKNNTEPPLSAKR